MVFHKYNVTSYNVLINRSSSVRMNKSLLNNKIHDTIGKYLNLLIILSEVKFFTDVTEKKYVEKGQLNFS
jgi:hypothetical protein